MKKILFTLGTAAAVISPFSTVVACDAVGSKGLFTPTATIDEDSKELEVIGLAYADKVAMDAAIASDDLDEDQLKDFLSGFAMVLKKPEFGTATTIVTGYGSRIDLTSFDNTDGGPSAVTKLDDLINHSWTASTIEGTEWEVSADEYMTYLIFTQLV